MGKGKKSADLKMGILTMWLQSKKWVHDDAYFLLLSPHPVTFPTPLFPQAQLSSILWPLPFAALRKLAYSYCSSDHLVLIRPLSIPEWRRAAHARLGRPRSSSMVGQMIVAESLVLWTVAMIGGGGSFELDAAWDESLRTTDGGR
jgi:hypothetical protein